MGVRGQRHAPGKGPPVPIVQEAGRGPEPVWTQRLEEKSFAPAGEWTPVIQSVVRHYIDWAIPAPMQNNKTLKSKEQNVTCLL
jgi:hypothetical protein